MKVERLEHKLGIKASDTAAFSFINCRVPAENLLGNPDIDIAKGFAGVMETFDNTRPLVAAMAVGCARASLERIKEILKNSLTRTMLHLIYKLHISLHRFIEWRRSGKQHVYSH